MVTAVRRGTPLRQVARDYNVDHTLVSRWVKRAGNKRLDRVCFDDVSSAPQTVKRTKPELEDRILELRRSLRDESPLGEYGPEAIHRALVEKGEPAPSPSTIKRILRRRGALDGKSRVRRKAPPPGWYLPDVRDRLVELDSLDVIEDLKIENGPLVDVLNLVALHGKRIRSWAVEGPFKSQNTHVSLLEHWREHGLPGYVQFDNATIFTGGMRHPDTLGTVVRLCLALGVTPVFAPVREHGLQNAVESANGRFQDKVWRRFHHASLSELQKRSRAYEEAYNLKNSKAIGEAPARSPFPKDSWLTLPSKAQGRVIFVRRSSEKGCVEILGRSHLVSGHWQHRLVRCELDLTLDELGFHGLRRAAHEEQPLIKKVPYSVPQKCAARVNLRVPR